MCRRMSIPCASTIIVVTSLLMAAGVAYQILFGIPLNAYPCSGDWILYNGKCYLVFLERAYELDAKSMCADVKGTLVTFDEPKELLRSLAWRGTWAEIQGRTTCMTYRYNMSYSDLKWYGNSTNVTTSAPRITYRYNVTMLPLYPGDNSYLQFDDITYECRFICVRPTVIPVRYE